ncbi:hypothetical protein [Bacillus sp. JJ1562]
MYLTYINYLHQNRLRSIFAEILGAAAEISNSREKTDTLLAYINGATS